jgi:cellulose synthase/poly-beta-1,6-N-acetylglucosamine synthase-like glycosyltransferase
VFFTFFLLLQLVFAIYITIPLLFLCCYGFLRLFKIKTPFEKRPVLIDRDFEFGLIITAHQEAEFVIPLVDSILRQTYKNFHAYVVADDCDTTALDFSDPRITILEPQPPLNAKVKSIHYAIDRFVKKPDAVIILDVDNLIHPHFLQVMNAYFQKGYKVVQADFKPKNIDTNYARMDAMGDMFNFFVEREMRMRLGLSSAIWGSGIAIDYDLYKEVEYADFLGGFDKKLQSHLVQRVDKIAFAAEAILFDEKITSGKSLENQRTRWISSYFKYFRESFKIFVKGLQKGSINLMYFGFIVLRPPLFLVIGISSLFTIIDFFIRPHLFFLWLAILSGFLLSFACIVLIKGKDIRFLRTFFIIPIFAVRQTASLLKMRKAKKSFMKTQHSKLVFISDLVK